jgi:undecaprenyl-diphosphatase
VAFWGQPLFQRGVLVVFAVVLGIRGHRRTALWLVLLAVAENVLAPATKLMLSRARPEWDHPIAVEHSLSYPSGHATAAAAFGLALLLVAPLVSDRVWVRVVLRSVVVVLALVICADRVFLGVHYLTDVVGGVLLGLLITTVAWLLLGLSRRHRRSPPPARVCHPGSGDGARPARPNR